MSVWLKRTHLSCYRPDFLWTFINTMSGVPISQAQIYVADLVRTCMEFTWMFHYARFEVVLVRDTCASVVDLCGDRLYVIFIYAPLLWRSTPAWTWAIYDHRWDTHSYKNTRRKGFCGVYDDDTVSSCYVIGSLPKLCNHIPHALQTGSCQTTVAWTFRIYRAYCPLVPVKVYSS